MNGLSILKAEQHINDFVHMLGYRLKNGNGYPDRAAYERNLYAASIFLKRSIKAHLDEEYCRLIDDYLITLLMERGVLSEYRRLERQFYNNANTALKTRAAKKDGDDYRIPGWIPKVIIPEEGEEAPTELLDESDIAIRALRQGGRIELQRF